MKNIARCRYPRVTRHFANDPRSNDSVQIKMKIEPATGYYIDASVNGHDVLFQVDTGATMRYLF